ncbi:STAS domain-containing protein [Rhodococcus sp. HNM0563]|uniref:STAS domain-containing protein n=1 Tax=unclassified Rhodococcus (in: high G+C Gram-positive bacteria) TaxID=192944 RepID=UPI00146A01C9|nr:MULTISPECIES: STAS domain-containing protein [unclassified Rhodococcus (in: high G+C Gram-positive bacteria)]MCK0090206.1 STAS domain-containing protein [Rhodococcus sp. F64268]NLU61414.1 STAS domain-containing protein [Rhodococcus sp. HNM0563]
MTATESHIEPSHTIRAVPSLAAISWAVGAQFRAQQISSALVRLGVTGEIDLRNASALSDYACRQLRSSQRMILDLSEVGFYGTAGLTVFRELDEVSRQSGARWALVGGRPVQRLLRIADPDKRISQHLSLESAMRSLSFAA